MISYHNKYLNMIVWFIVHHLVLYYIAKNRVGKLRQFIFEKYIVWPVNYVFNTSYYVSSIIIVLSGEMKRVREWKYNRIVRRSVGKGLLSFLPVFFVFDICYNGNQGGNLISFHS